MMGTNTNGGAILVSFNVGQKKSRTIVTTHAGISRISHLLCISLCITVTCLRPHAQHKSESHLLSDVYVCMRECVFVCVSVCVFMVV